MKTVPALLRLDPDVASMLEAAAIKLRCSKSAVVEALIRIECGLPTDDPIAEWFKSRGAKSTQTDYGKLTEADMSAKRPRGARVSAAAKAKAAQKSKRNKDTPASTAANAGGEIRIHKGATVHQVKSGGTDTHHHGAR